MTRTIPVDARLEARLEAYRAASAARRAAAERVQALFKAGQSTEEAFRAFLDAERNEDRAAHAVAVSVEHRVDELERGAA